MNKSNQAAAPAWSGVANAPGDPGALAAEVAKNAVETIMPQSNMRRIPTQFVPEHPNNQPLTPMELKERNEALRRANSISPEDLRTIITFLQNDITRRQKQMEAIIVRLTPRLSSVELANIRAAQKHAEMIQPNELQKVIDFLNKDIEERKKQMAGLPREKPAAAPAAAAAAVAQVTPSVSIAAELKAMSKKEIERSLMEYVRSSCPMLHSDDLKTIVSWIKNDVLAMEWLIPRIQNNRLDREALLKKAWLRNSLFANPCQETLHTYIRHDVRLDDNEEGEDEKEYTYLDHAIRTACDTSHM